MSSTQLTVISPLFRTQENKQRHDETDRDRQQKSRNKDV